MQAPRREPPHSRSSRPVPAPLQPRATPTEFSSLSVPSDALSVESLLNEFPVRGEQAGTLCARRFATRLAFAHRPSGMLAMPKRSLSTHARYSVLRVRVLVFAQLRLPSPPAATPEPNESPTSRRRSAHIGAARGHAGPRPPTRNCAAAVRNASLAVDGIGYGTGNDGFACRAVANDQISVHWLTLTHWSGDRPGLCPVLAVAFLADTPAARAPGAVALKHPAG